MIYANNSKGDPVHVLDAVKRINYHCHECQDSLRPHQGSKQPWAFFHVENPDCNCIKGDRRGKGCIFRLSRYNICKSAEICQKSECKYKK